MLRAMREAQDKQVATLLLYEQGFLRWGVWYEDLCKFSLSSGSESPRLGIRSR